MSFSEILFSQVIIPHKEKYLEGTNLVRKYQTVDSEEGFEA